MEKRFKGTYTAVVTPFTKENKIDWEAMERIVEKQLAAGVEGIVFLGTTGESPTLCADEYREVLQRSVRMVNGRCQVIHGTGSNNTQHAIEQAKIAEKAGADAQLVVNPYYNKPTQEGLYAHFTAIADATDVPVIVYNILGRTGVNIETPTLLRMAEHENIVAVKEASGDMEQMMEVIRSVPQNFSVMIGDDALALPFMAAGGDGVVSVIANCIPKTMSEFVRTCMKGDYKKARTQFYAMLDLMKVSFIESNPIPVKEIMGLLGLCQPAMRLPLTGASENSMKQIRGIISLINELEK